jgi:hypothetical protein
MLYQFNDGEMGSKITLKYAPALVAYCTIVKGLWSFLLCAKGCGNALQRGRIGDCGAEGV